MALAVADRGVSLDERLVDAALRCVARWGLAKTSLDDVAREAGCSRATAYRLFPGGKDGLVEAVAGREFERFVARVRAAVERADDLDGRLAAGIAQSARCLRESAALQFLLDHEPEAVLPRVAFGHCDAILDAASRSFAPLLRPWLSGEDAARAVEWATRIVLSYVVNPSDAFDIGDDRSVQRLVRTFVLPGLVA